MGGSRLEALQIAWHGRGGVVGGGGGEGGGRGEGGVWVGGGWGEFRGPESKGVGPPNSTVCHMGL